MATIHADAGGRLLRLLKNAGEEAMYPSPPPDATQTLAFDETTNAGVIAGILEDWDSHALDAGVLLRGGTPVAIAPDSPDTAIRKLLDSQGETILAALRAGTATSSQAQRALAYLLARALRGA